MRQSEKQVWLPPPFRKRKEVVRYEYISGIIINDRVWNANNIANLLNYCSDKDNNKGKKLITLPASSVIK